MSIHNWPISEQPRAKLLLKGAQSLSDAELLAIFLRTGVRGKSAVDLARELLVEFGSLANIISADQQQFCLGHGLGPSKYAQLQATVEMSRRYLQESLPEGEQLQGSQQTKNFLKAQLHHYQQEVFACLLLDKKHRIIRFQKLFFGSISSATIHPREVVKTALRYNAASMIFTHNHPSGDSRPSQADIDITQELQAALALVEVRVLDHVIVGNKYCYSFAEAGLLA